LICAFFFLFSSRRVNTMCYRDWSSVVCSSDLLLDSMLGPDLHRARAQDHVDMILSARSMVVRVELGIQQARHSTLNSYLEKLLRSEERRVGTEGRDLHTTKQTT